MQQCTCREQSFVTEPVAEIERTRLQEEKQALDAFRIHVLRDVRQQQYKLQVGHQEHAAFAGLTMYMVPHAGLPLTLWFCRLRETCIS